MKLLEFFKKRWKYIVSISISILLLTLILLFGVDFTVLKEILISTNLIYLSGAFLLYILGLIIGALKILYLLKINDYHISIFRVILYHTFGMLFSAFTPATVSKTLSIFFIGQMFDFALRIPISIVGIILIITKPFKNNFLWLALVGIFILIVLSLMAYVLSSGKFFKIESIIEKRYPKLSIKLRNYKEQYKDLKWRQSLLIAALTLIGWIIFSLKWFLISHAISFPLSLPDCAFLLPLIFIISFLPISVAGLGFVEGGVILLYTLRFPQFTQTFLGSIAVTFMILERTINILTALPGIFTFFEVSK
ncbi:MAG: lysylphosphatidylglycerol synthase transmembrane domain-containing protein [Candidatus Heimdallarchaeaceae archaeon]